MSCDVEEKLQEALKEIKRIKQENAELRQVLLQYQNQDSSQKVKNNMKEEKLYERVLLFRSLFKGREDVFAYRWDMNDGKSGYSPARNKNRLVSLTNQAIYDHLSGEKTIGIYPVLHDNTCWFLAVDFDKKSWIKDVCRFVQTCSDAGLPTNLEKSRSGNGCHVWIFFQEPIKANIIRKLCNSLLAKTKKKSGLSTLESYDRMFPNQDVVPEGKFGNLIALPMQGKPRRKGNSVFVDENFTPYPNQWGYLSKVKKVRKKDVYSLVDRSNDVGFVSEGPKRSSYVEKIPEKLSILKKNGIHISKHGLPRHFMQELTRLATFSNPAFYKAERKRLSTKDIPRTIDCSDETEDKLILPRGCMKNLEQLLEQKAISTEVSDERNFGTKLDIEFHGSLSFQQEKALQELSRHETGVLSAATGFGKTVVAAALIAKRRINSLIIVHRTHLLDQWKEHLKVFLEKDPSAIGQIGAGKNTAKGNVDVATIQSLSSGGAVKDIVKDYGQVIVDECHHTPAVTFEKVLKKVEAANVYGLTATTKRKDGWERITFAQLGPIRYRINSKNMAKVRPFRHILVPRYTEFKSSQKDIQAIYSELAVDKNRNEMIFNDVLSVLEEGKSPIILTERVEHVRKLESMFKNFTKNLIILRGQLNKKEERERLNRLNQLNDNEERLIIATGKYIGEGFDNKRLDTMFLTMPISWKGTLEQYVGRLHRIHDWKTDVQVYDYIDNNISMLARMFENRKRGYKTLGYVHKNHGASVVSEQMNLF